MGDMPRMYSIIDTVPTENIKLPICFDRSAVDLAISIWNAVLDRLRLASAVSSRSLAASYSPYLLENSMRHSVSIIS